MLIIIRGTACSGKSIVADELKKYFKNQKKLAVIHTSIFYHGIVYGDKPEVAMENTKRILDNYLKNKYDVILEGTLSFKDKKGKLYLDNFVKLSKKYKTPLKQFFFQADFSELKKREKKRRKISLKLLKKMYDITMNSKKKDEIIIDTTNKTIKQVINEVKRNLE